MLASVAGIVFCCGFSHTVSQKEKFDVRLLSSFTTRFDGGNAARSHNIRLAAKLINGSVVKNGETFSFNATVGQRTPERGFKRAKIIENGEFVEGIGGGVCQASTTIYNAVLTAGLKIEEWHRHTLKSSYVKPSFDAMVNSNGADLVFVNDTASPIYIRTLWKDIPFAAAVLCFGCALMRFVVMPTPSFAGSQTPFLNRIRRRQQIVNWSIYIVSGLMLCLFRSNGWYAFLLCLPFLLIHFRKKAKNMYPVLFGILVTVLIIKIPVMNAFAVTQPDLIESLSIPTQQISAVLCNDRYLSPEELDLIENVVDLTYIKELYNPYFADNIKELVRAGDQSYLETHKEEFFKLWLRLGLRYPGDYLTAYMHQTYGYWYPDSFYPVADAEGVSATSLGVSHTPLIRGPLVVKGKEIAIKLGGILPLYGILWSMGAACWVLIFCIGNSLIRGEISKLILYLPSLALLFTVLIATPVATEFRYVYFLVFSLPFYVITTLMPVSDPGQASRHQD